MKIIEDQTEYTIKFSKQELKDMWWFANDYLCMNPDSKSDSFKKAKWITDNLKFVVQ